MSDPPKLSLRQESLLVFLGVDQSEALDPVRIMKGMFVFSKEAPGTWISTRERYKFKPYLYGPFSQDVYHDLDHLVNQGLVLMADVPDRSWKKYSLSPAGENLKSNLNESKLPEAIYFLNKTREWVSSLDFRALLSEIYKKYPKYASSSILTTSR